MERDHFLSFDVEAECFCFEFRFVVFNLGIAQGEVKKGDNFAGACGFDFRFHSGFDGIAVVVSWMFAVQPAGAGSIDNVVWIRMKGNFHIFSECEFVNGVVVANLVYGMMGLEFHYDGMAGGTFLSATAEVRIKMSCESWETGDIEKDVLSDMFVVFIIHDDSWSKGIPNPKWQGETRNEVS
jgi:hypothetical protein